MFNKSSSTVSEISALVSENHFQQEHLSVKFYESSFHMDAPHEKNPHKNEPPQDFMPANLNSSPTIF